MSTQDQHTELNRDEQPVDVVHADRGDRGAEQTRDIDIDSAPEDRSQRDVRHDERHDDAADFGAGVGTEPRPEPEAETRTEARTEARSEQHTDASAGTAAPNDQDPERLVPRDRADAYSSRWDAVKGTFVDEPRRAVAEADALVGELLDDMERLFREQRSRLEHGLDAEETSTEDLRVALRRYRSFFDRLLSL